MITIAASVLSSFLFKGPLYFLCTHFVHLRPNFELVNARKWGLRFLILSSWNFIWANVSSVLSVPIFLFLSSVLRSSRVFSCDFVRDISFRTSVGCAWIVFGYFPNDLTGFGLGISTIFKFISKYDCDWLVVQPIGLRLCIWNLPYELTMKSSS